MSFDPSYMRDIDYYFMEKTEGGSPEVPTQAMPTKMRDFINALRDSHLLGRFEVGSIVLSLDSEGRDKFQQGLNTLDSGMLEGRQRTFRIPFTEVSIGLTITYVDDVYWREELVRSAVQMIQGKCSRWLVVQLANKFPYTVIKIIAIYPGMFSDAELIPGKLHLEEKTQNTIRDRRPGRNDPCLCGSGKKYKKCHGR
jgi:hypothetical protein